MDLLQEPPEKLRLFLSAIYVLHCAHRDCDRICLAKQRLCRGTPWRDPVPEANCKVCKPIERFDENKFNMECDGAWKKETSVDCGL